MERRSFLGGLLLAAASPAVLGDIGEAAAAPEDVVQKSLGASKGWTPIRNRLRARIHAHHALFNCSPQCLFVNRDEFDELLAEISPQVRYTNVEAAKVGYDNLEFMGVPVVFADQTLPFYIDEVLRKQYQSRLVEQIHHESPLMRVLKEES
jgi:hypothetical protein